MLFGNRQIAASAAPTTMKTCAQPSAEPENPGIDYPPTYNLKALLGIFLAQSPLLGVPDATARY
ncbi:hypothetical protein Cenrod_2610 [Candidatus Symbiobacter mobilis CR]|uniref:Uncharacterized protein n=1 Tax=Candidatus Symbiobacter mobilis CR TaxID=946483 RepID=U5NAR2_9BURK|nr:hypothetical protein Cenrod_2610 [Candidatus Symbiobacter mobilis CR]